LNTDEMHQAPFALSTSSCLKVGVGHCTILQTSQSLVTEIVEVLNFPSDDNGNLFSSPYYIGIVTNPTLNGSVVCQI
ncbi:unnamed protein product, partial [Rotaria sp. Silwood1]